MSFSLIDFSSLQKSELVKVGPKKNKSIKNISSVRSSEITSKDIVESLRNKFYTHKYIINNTYIYNWESDFFSITELDYAFEIEVKVTKGDFKDDFNKTEKHILLESSDADKNYLKPNKFFYAAPKNLLPSAIIPSYAGLIEIDPVDRVAYIVKDAPYLHKQTSLNQLKDILLDKYYSRYKDFISESY